MTYRSLISVRQLREKLVALRLIDGTTTSPSSPPPPPSGNGADPLRVCDATVTSADPASDFLFAHIPGAVFFDLNECADRSSGLTRTVPKPEVFEEYVNSLGIGASTEIVAYDCTSGFGGLFSAPRLWWLFRLFGHDSVRVLDGGFDQWRRQQQQQQHSVSSSATVPRTEPPPKNYVFRAKLRPRLLATFEQVQDRSEEEERLSPSPSPSSSSSSTSDFRIIDARGRGDYAAARLPASRNLLFKLLVDPATGTLKSTSELEGLFSSNAGVDLTTPGLKFASSCVTGTTSCALNLAADRVAEERGLAIETAVYDGSIQEWMARGGVTESG